MSDLARALVYGTLLGLLGLTVPMALAGEFPGATGGGGAGDYLVVADVTARDALSPSDGDIVMSLASGIVWRRAVSPGRWIIVDNVSEDAFDNDVNALVPVYNIFVETTGSDTAGEGTVADPFATIDTALRAMPRALAGQVIIELGAGTFTVGPSGFSNITPAGSYPWGLWIRGTTTSVASVSLGSTTDVGLLAGKYAQYRSGIGAYGFTVVEGDHFLDDTTSGFEDFAPNYIPLLASSSTPNIDRVATGALSKDVEIFTLATTVSPVSGSIDVHGNAGAEITFVTLKLTGGTTFMQHASMQGVDASGISTLIMRDGVSSIRGAYLDSTAVRMTGSRGRVVNAIVNDGPLEILGSNELFTAVTLVLRENGVAMSVGKQVATIGRRSSFAQIGSIDFEPGASGQGLLLTGKGSGVVLQGSMSVTGGSRALFVNEGAQYTRSFGVWTGTTTTTPVLVGAQSHLEDVAASFTGLTNSVTAGEQLQVGANAAGLYTAVPQTDYALGNTSLGAIAQ